MNVCVRREPCTVRIFYCQECVIACASGRVRARVCFFGNEINLLDGVLYCCCCSNGSHTKAATWNAICIKLEISSFRAVSGDECEGIRKAHSDAHKTRKRISFARNCVSIQL